MATTFKKIPVGVSAVIPVTPLLNVSAGPSVLGGTVLVEFSVDGRSMWQPWTYGTISQGGSFRAPGSLSFRARVSTKIRPATSLSLPGILPVRSSRRSGR